MHSAEHLLQNVLLNLGNDLLALGRQVGRQIPGLLATQPLDFLGAGMRGYRGRRRTVCGGVFLTCSARGFLRRGTVLRESGGNGEGQYR